MIVIKYDSLKNVTKKKKRLLGNVTVGKFENIIDVRFGKYSYWEWINKGRRKKIFFLKED